jgi:hypothetical protein
VTFNVLYLYYPYNTIFGRGFTNKFNTTIHMGYLCMKMLALHGTITVHDSQKEARNIERAIYKSQCNINFVKSAKNNTPEPSDMPKGKTNLKDQEETMSALLENIVLDKKTYYQRQSIGGSRGRAHRDSSQEQRCLCLISI